MSQAIDEPRDVREGESLDETKLEKFLKEKIPGIEGNIQIRQFPSGASNLTYSVQFDNNDYVLRRPPFGKKPKSGHDMWREYRIQRDIKSVFPAVPEVVLYCDEPEVLGCEFYLMERVKGIIYRKELPEGINLNKDQVRTLCTNLLDKLIDIHTCDYKSAGLADLGKPQGYVRRQVEGWTKRYQDAWTEDAPTFEKTLQWLHDNIPVEVAPGVIHNDYRFDNAIMSTEDATEILAILDWEMATIGDPLMDLGNTLCPWIEAADPQEWHMVRMQPTHLDGMLSRDEVIHYYLDKTGFKCDDFSFYSIWGFFRLAAIIQQIYYRFFHGQTKDERFGQFIHMVHMLEQRSLQALP